MALWLCFDPLLQLGSRFPWGAYRQALSWITHVQEKHPDQVDEDDVYKCKAALGKVYLRCGKGEEAMHQCEEVLAHQRRTMPADHIDIVLSMSDLAGTYSMLGRQQEAIVLCEEVLESSKRILDPDHPTLAASMCDLALLYGATGQHEQAVGLLESAMQLRKRVLPDDHPAIGSAMAALANAYAKVGRHHEAVMLQEEALDFRKNSLPADHNDIVASLNSLTASYMSLGLQEEAATLEEEMLVSPPCTERCRAAAELARLCRGVRLATQRCADRASCARCSPFPLLFAACCRWPANDAQRRAAWCTCRPFSRTCCHPITKG